MSSTVLFAYYKTDKHIIQKACRAKITHCMLQQLVVHSFSFLLGMVAMDTRHFSPITECMYIKMDDMSPRLKRH